MACDICGQKMSWCSCTQSERDIHDEVEELRSSLNDLQAERDELHETLLRLSKCKSRAEVITAMVKVFGLLRRLESTGPEIEP